ncbi:hypothetical protein T484DRAFT_1618320, partial [Baffinella frigidus]
NPKPETRNPKPETRNPKPETRNPKPETRNPPQTLLTPALKPTPIPLTQTGLHRVQCVPPSPISLEKAAVSGPLLDHQLMVKSSQRSFKKSGVLKFVPGIGFWT